MTEKQLQRITQLLGEYNVTKMLTGYETTSVSWDNGVIVLLCDNTDEIDILRDGTAMLYPAGFDVGQGYTIPWLDEEAA